MRCFSPFRLKLSAAALCCTAGHAGSVWPIVPEIDQQQCHAEADSCNTQCEWVYRLSSRYISGGRSGTSHTWQLYLCHKGDPIRQLLCLIGHVLPLALITQAHSQAVSGLTSCRVGVAPDAFLSHPLMIFFGYVWLTLHAWRHAEHALASILARIASMQQSQFLITAQLCSLFHSSLWWSCIARLVQLLMLPHMPTSHCGRKRSGVLQGNRHAYPDSAGFFVIKTHPS